MILLSLLFSCIDESSSKRVLEQQGYEDIQITGYRWLSCSKNDFYHTGFKAKTTNGPEITGVVCEGLLFKGNTIRLD